MDALTAKLRSSPFIARVAPYIIFVALTALQGKFGEASKYWFYLAKTIVGIWLVWAMWPVVKEMRWTFSIEAVFVGVGVIVVWIALDPFYPKLDSSVENPDHRNSGTRTNNSAPVPPSPGPSSSRAFSAAH
jgi:hypothetical protein